MLTRGHLGSYIGAYRDWCVLLEETNISGSGEYSMITLNGVTKLFGTVKAVENISLKITSGNPVVLVGPSGSGKTTLLRLISGLDTPDSGEIYFDGVMASTRSYVVEPHKRNLGFVFQTPALWPHMTVAQNIMFGLAGKPKEKVFIRLNKLILATSLEGLERRYPHQLSGGEARRVSLARTLAPQPKYLLMDEPLSNLDPELKDSMLSLIKDEVACNGACLLYVTHDAAEAQKLTLQIIALKNGRIDTG